MHVCIHTDNYICVYIYVYRCTSSTGRIKRALTVSLAPSCPFTALAMGFVPFEAPYLGILSASKRAEEVDVDIPKLYESLREAGHIGFASP